MVLLWRLRLWAAAEVDLSEPYLYAGSRVLSAQAAGQSPAAGGDVRHFGNGLHLLRAADTHLEGGKRQTVCVFTNQKQQNSEQMVLLAESIGFMFEELNRHLRNPFTATQMFHSHF